MSRSELVDITGELRHETKPGDPDAGAYLIYDGSKEVWLPKAAVEYDKDEGVFTMPRALAMAKGLI